MTAERRPQWPTQGRLARAAALALALALLSCAPRPARVDVFVQAISNAEEVTIFAVDERHYDVGLYVDVKSSLELVLARLASGEGVHARLPVGQPGERALLGEAIAKSASDEWGGVQCFLPRHVIVARGKKEVMVGVLCLECQYLVIFDDSGHATTGFCDFARLDRRWHEAFASLGHVGPEPRPTNARCEDAKREHDARARTR